MISYSIPIADDDARAQARRWLFLGLFSLILSGLFAVLIVLARTPYLQDIIPFADFFHSALVVHVDLSVLVWFLAFAGVLWSINGTARWRVCGGFALLLAALGALFMAVAPFTGDASPLMSNYIPILQQPVFYAALLSFGAGIALLVLRALFFPRPVGMEISGTGALRFGLNTAVVATAIAFIALLWSYLKMPPFIQGGEYFELLFWGGGHVLQFTHTQLMLVAWLWLASATGVPVYTGPRVVLFLFAWGLLTVFATPIIYLAFDVNSLEHRRLFTWQMEFGGSLASLWIGIALLAGLWKAEAAPSQARAERAALTTSVLLFGIGGIIGFLISGSNVTVPAHYHGCIVGVTLAFMGMSYHLLPQLGFAAPSQTWATRQSWIYATGQLIHIVGLAWSGGYGVQRKTAGMAQGLDSLERIVSMGMMGLGGLIAIIGGLMFLLIVFHAMLRTRR
ncbi:MAG: cbb3-type cytochrome c oxidase subunit I [Gammaproteobacteria bacterium]|nr:cbb3-type cytochrome c oxidase subunit I [Gammaproteobacteria bacterium]